MSCQACLILLVVIASCAAAIPSPRFGERIVGGYPIDIKDAPFQASLSYKGRSGCGGSIISSRFILSARHCTINAEPVSNYRVRVGSSRTNKGGEVFKVAKIYHHDGNSLIDYDFSLLELETPIAFNETRQPVKLPHADYSVPDGTMLSTFGWGATRHPHQREDFLRRVELPKVDIDYCLQANHLDGKHREQKICAGFQEDGKSICHGDSGGPLMTSDGVLVGVSTFVRQCGMKEYPSVFGKVTSILDWINSIVKE